MHGALHGTDPVLTRVTRGLDELRMQRHTHVRVVGMTNLSEHLGIYVSRGEPRIESSERLVQSSFGDAAELGLALFGHLRQIQLAGPILTLVPDVGLRNQPEADQRHEVVPCSVIPRR